MTARAVVPRPGPWAVRCAKTAQGVLKYRSCELTCSTLLFLGLGTRLVALPFLGMIAMIQTLVYPDAWVEYLAWTSILLFFVARRGGVLSLDHIVARRFGARPR